jgi:hypothetical protein
MKKTYIHLYINIYIFTYSNILIVQHQIKHIVIDFLIEHIYI